MFYFSPISNLLFACTAPEKPSDTAQNIESISPLDLTPTYSQANKWPILQSSDDWWTEEDDRTNVFGGAGLLIGDLDADGLLDLVLLRRRGVQIWLNRGTSWEEFLAPQIRELPATGAIVDYDMDGDQDIYIATVYGNDWLWTNEDGQWMEQAIDSPDYTGGSTWYDFNNDGLLDFALAGYGNDFSYDLAMSLENNTPYPGEANRLFLQQADHQFIESDALIGLAEWESFSFQLSVLPYIHSTDWDILSINDFGHINHPHQLFSNQGNGQFALEAANHGLDVEMFGMGVAATDINHDGIPDPFITNIGQPAFLVSDGHHWVNMAVRYGLIPTEERYTCWAVDWHDVNNDGHEDLWTGCGPLPIHSIDSPIPNPPNQPDALFLWTEDGFVDISEEWGLDRRSNTRSGGFADLNNDGCWELIRVPRDGEMEIFNGTCPSEYNWLDIRLQDGHQGIGATVQVHYKDQTWTDWMVGGGSSFATYLPQELHFGLGTADQVDITVTWKDGSIQILKDVAVNQKLQIQKDT